MALGFDLKRLKVLWGRALDEVKVSLTIDTLEGTVLLVGRNNTTLQNIVVKAQLAVGKPMRVTFDGSHTFPPYCNEISRPASSLRNGWKEAWIVPAHAASEPAFAHLPGNSADCDLNAGLGAALRLGSEIEVQPKSYQRPKHAIEVWG